MGRASTVLAIAAALAAALCHPPPPVAARAAVPAVSALVPNPEGAPVSWTLTVRGASQEARTELGAAVREAKATRASPAEHADLDALAVFVNALLASVPDRGVSLHAFGHRASGGVGHVQFSLLRLPGTS